MFDDFHVNYHFEKLVEYLKAANYPHKVTTLTVNGASCAKIEFSDKSYKMNYSDKDDGGKIKFVNTSNVKAKEFIGKMNSDKDCDDSSKDSEEEYW